MSTKFDLSLSDVIDLLSSSSNNGIKIQGENYKKDTYLFVDKLGFFSIYHDNVISPFIISTKTNQQKYRII